MINFERSLAQIRLILPQAQEALALAQQAESLEAARLHLVECERQINQISLTLDKARRPDEEND